MSGAESTVLVTLGKGEVVVTRKALLKIQGVLGKEHLSGKEIEQFVNDLQERKDE